MSISHQHMAFGCSECGEPGRRERRRFNFDGGNVCTLCLKRAVCTRRKAAGNYVVTDAQRKKMSLAKLGKPAPWNSYVRSAETRKKLSESHKDKPNPRKGIHLVPPEQRRKNENVHDCCSRMVRRVLQIKDEKKVRRTFEYLGYTKSDFVRHIEGQFRPGMSWNNYGEWQVDHIKPVSLFVRDGVVEPRVINALPNLQPLWRTENLRKGSTYAVSS